MITGLSFRRSLILGLTLAVIGLSSPANAQSVTKTFSADDSVQLGMLVQPDAKDKNHVQPAERSKPKAVSGVVVQPNDSPVSLTGPSNQRQVYVASTGPYKLLVSDQNGPIKKNDFIVLSSINGIGMLADKETGFTVGKAQSDFDGQTGVISEAAVQDSTGKRRAVHFGYVTADVVVGSNPLYQNPNNTTGVPGVLKELVESVAGKQVGLVRTYISLFVALLTAIIVIFVMVTGIRSSVTALGRNPLARQSILRNLVQVLMIGLIILIVGMFGVYLLLKL